MNSVHFDTGLLLKFGVPGTTTKSGVEPQGCAPASLAVPSPGTVAPLGRDGRTCLGRTQADYLPAGFSFQQTDCRAQWCQET